MFCVFFFFSSRRRHTRCLSDWSSDVCSSDLSVMIGRLRESISRVAHSDAPEARTKWMQPTPLRKDLIEDLARVLGSEAHLSYHTGDYIVREGQIGVLMYVVLRGKVTISVGEKLVETVG